MVLHLNEQLGNNAGLNFKLFCVSAASRKSTSSQTPVNVLTVRIQMATAKLKN